MGNPNVILFTPVSLANINRYDDTIDYYENIDKQMEPNVNLLNQGIYPFEGWMNKRTGERVTHREYQWVHGTLKDLNPPWDEIKDVFENMNINSIEEARENIVPQRTRRSKRVL